jgi:hypothetical protein
MMFLIGILVAVLLASGGFAQDADEESRPAYIKAGTLLDVRNGATLANQAILIEGEFVDRVTSQADLDVSAGARVIDLGDSTVMPGLNPSKSAPRFFPATRRKSAAKG